MKNYLHLFLFVVGNVYFCSRQKLIRKVYKKNVRLMRISLKKVVSPPLAITVLLVISPLLFWLISMGFSNPTAVTNFTTPPGDALQQFFLENAFLAGIVNIGLSLINVFLIAQLNNRFTIIRNRTFLPVLIYLILVSMWSEIHIVVCAHLAATMLLISLFVFFDMYRNANASEQAFLGSLLIAVASVFAPVLLLLIPVCWLGFMRFYSFSLRTWLASLFGALVPWVFYFAYMLYYKTDYYWLNDLGQSFFIGLPVFSRPLYEMVYIALMVVFMIIGLFGLYTNLHSDSIQTRAKLNFLVFILVAAFVFSFFFVNQFIVFLPVIALAYSLLIAHAFTLRLTNFYGILFILFVIINVAFGVFNLIDTKFLL
ncbi:MAG: hypothetical protein PHH37_13995 [Paludibacter sp.]|nr:hypothetical protein [Paludibacter sp.]